MAGAKVAVISGGGSGMGMEAARQLAERGDWHIHILEIDQQRGSDAAARLGKNVVPHQTDVTDYASLSNTFHDIFKDEGRLDFVFANAGIKETGDMYAVAQALDPPKEINQLTIDLNLKSVVNQCYLASHYFQLSPHKGQGANLVATGSAGSLYSLDSAPMYAASKFGVLGFIYSIAKVFKKRFGIRVNTVLPAPVATNLVTKEEWQSFDQSMFTPPAAIVDMVLRFVDGKDMTDSNGVSITGEEAFGRAAEVVKDKFYFRVQQDWCDDVMFKAMTGNDL